MTSAKVILDSLREIYSNNFRLPRCLESEYSASVWVLKTTDWTIFVDFNIALSDGSLLSSSKNKILCNFFKNWICLQDMPETGSGVTLQFTSLKSRFAQTLTLIDWCLLNDVNLNLLTGSPLTFTDSFAKTLLQDLSCHSDTSIALYKWPQRVANYLRESSIFISTQDITAAARKWEGITQLDCNERLTNLSDDELIRSRVWAAMNGFIKRGRSDFTYTLASSALAKIILKNTLRGHVISLELPEFSFSPTKRTFREFSAVPIRSKADAHKNSAAATYLGPLRSLRFLSCDEITISSNALALLAKGRGYTAGNTYSQGRYKTLPFSVAMKALRDAVEFCELYANPLLNAYATYVASQMQNGAKGPRRTDCVSTIGGTLPFPIQVWNLSAVIGGTELQKSNSPERSASLNSYFQRFRNGEGLFELIRVLWGALQIVIGTFSARRQGELIDLIAGETVDTARRRLIILNRKSGAFGRRIEIRRPVINFVIEIIASLENFQSGLSNLGFAGLPTNLLARPHASKFKLNCTPVQMNDSFNAFCDFTETARDHMGRRYYIRQHQLRRFFVQAFLHGHAYGGLNTLRWFLGHTDPQHLWSYLTEEIPGDALQSGKAAWASEAIAAGANEAAALTRHIELITGNTNVRLMASADLEDLLDDLLEEGRISIEPHFFSDDAGRTYNILISIYGDR